MTLTAPAPTFPLTDLIRDFFASLKPLVQRRPYAMRTEGDEEQTEEEEEPNYDVGEDDDRSLEKTMEKLFGEEPFEPRKKPDEEDEEESDEDESEEGEEESDEDESEEDEEESDEDESGQDEEVDYEADDEPDVEEEDRETIAQRDARENGRKVKELETELAEQRLAAQRQEEELAEARQQLADLNQLTVDPKSDPEFQKLNEEMWDDVDAAVAEEFPASAAGFSNRYPGYLKHYLGALKLRGDERAKATSELKTLMVEEQGGFEVPFEEMDDDEKVAANQLAKDMLSVLRRNAPRAQELIKLEATVRDRAKSGRVSVNLREYENRRKSLSPVVESVGKMDDELIKENPYAPEAILTSMAKENPTVKKKLDQARQDVVEVFLGPRPLSQQEYDKLEDQGVNIKDFLKERQKKFTDKRDKLARILIQVLPTLNITNNALKDITEKAREKVEEDDELEILGNLERKRKKAPRKKKKAVKKPQVPASERPSAIDKYLDG